MTSAVPRLLWVSKFTVPTRTSNPVGSNPACSVISPNCGWKPTALLLRRFGSSPPSTDVTYEQLKVLLAGQKSTVIDVREPWELREYGIIPGSINVPLGQVNTALQLGPEDFREKYGGEMPQQADKIVFSCLAGIRSKKALDQATSLGYKNVQHYPGGWQEWMKNEQLK
uniref:Sulfurtransferase n=1 Tax=Takifugu rubripes TaxID=31033 RepID=A0A674N4B5_TAKRU